MRSHVWAPLPPAAAPVVVDLRSVAGGGVVVVVVVVAAGGVAAVLGGAGETGRAAAAACAAAAFPRLGAIFFFSGWGWEGMVCRCGNLGRELGVVGLVGCGIGRC
jgi:hypothetical protein